MLEEIGDEGAAYVGGPTNAGSSERPAREGDAGSSDGEEVTWEEEGAATLGREVETAARLDPPSGATDDNREEVGDGSGETATGDAPCF